MAIKTLNIINVAPLNGHQIFVAHIEDHIEGIGNYNILDINSGTSDRPIRIDVNYHSMGYKIYIKLGVRANNSDIFAPLKDEGWDVQYDREWEHALSHTILFHPDQDIYTINANTYLDIVTNLITRAKKPNSATKSRIKLDFNEVVTDW